MIAWDLWIIDDIVMAPYRFITDRIDDKVSDLIGDFFNWIAGLLLAGVLWLFDVLWEFMNKSTSPDLGAAWYANGPYQICLYLGVTLLVMTVLMAVADSLWHRDGSALLRTVVEGLPKAMFVLTGLLTLTTWGVQLGDAITAWLMDSYGAGMRAFPDNIRAATRRHGVRHGPARRRPAGPGDGAGDCSSCWANSSSARATSTSPQR